MNKLKIFSYIIIFSFLSLGAMKEPAQITVTNKRPKPSVIIRMKVRLKKDKHHYKPIKLIRSPALSEKHWEEIHQFFLIPEDKK